MLSRINKILNSEQLEAVLKTLFRDRPVKILRIIAATGRSQVSWIHIENTVSGKKLATFISFQDLIDSFWEWLRVLEMFALAAWEAETRDELTPSGQKLILDDPNGIAATSKIATIFD